tara:strand:+ start:252 stop:746 length:495 start_codon:yes stop_codon:yes gene_type:complete
MKNSEIYSNEKYEKLIKNNNFFYYLKIFHLNWYFLLLPTIFIERQLLFKSIIIIFFIMHIHWDIFKECMISYFQKKKLNKNYKLAELEFLHPDFLGYKIKKNKIISKIFSSYLFYIPPLIAFILLKNKTELIYVLIGLTFLLNFLMAIKIGKYFSKFNEYGEQI